MDVFQLFGSPMTCQIIIIYQPALSILVAGFPDLTIIFLSANGALQVFHFFQNIFQTDLQPSVVSQLQHAAPQPQLTSAKCLLALTRWHLAAARKQLAVAASMLAVARATSHLTRSHLAVPRCHLAVARWQLTLAASILAVARRASHLTR